MTHASPGASPQAERRSSARFPRRWAWALAVLYVVALGASWVVRARVAPPVVDAERRTLMVQSVDWRAGGARPATSAEPVRIAFRDIPARHMAPSDRPGPEPLPVVLLHGSPGSGRGLRLMGERLAEHRRVIVPDLPGFGASRQTLPDYSFRAHAAYVGQLLEALRIPRAHFVGYSMGGGVVLSVVRDAPQRAVSVTMLAAIGAQEFELVGDYTLNHLVHGAQLVGLWGLNTLVPHFGWLDGGGLDLAYARNFYDSDQRPLRGVLETLSLPTLIVHGTRDSLVPVEAAREHARLVPQSLLVELDDDHFMPFRSPEAPSDAVDAFLSAVERGEATTRATASAERQANAAGTPLPAPRLDGIAGVVAALLLATATLVSEDLTSVGAGMLAARGRMSLGLAIAGCFIGIFVGDALLFLAGRWLGRSGAGGHVIRRFVGTAALDRSATWLEQRGASVILTTRFVPGTRLPTYVAAGLIGVSPWRFFAYFACAAALWTPLIVGASALPTAGLARLGMFAPSGLLETGVLLVGIFLFIRLVARISTHRGRRALVGSWRRLTRWEFWPPWVVYPPVVLYVLTLMVRHRGVTVFTSANPAIIGGGFVGESKAEILTWLAQATDRVPAFIVLESAAGLEARRAAARAFAAERGLPVVLKPDQGQRGSGVVVARTPAQLDADVAACGVDTILQRYVPGVEYGLFYYRRPGEAHGHVFSITEKRRAEVIGDGRRTLEGLILDDPRAVALAQTYLEMNTEGRDAVPARGQRVTLSELGTHCRGSIFLDGREVSTPALVEAVDRIGRAAEGFYFGRFDVRAASVDALRAGEFSILELNGVTSEATHIYDPRHSLWAAYRTLFEQWRLAFEIGAANRARGVTPTPLRTLVRLWRSYQRSAGAHLKYSTRTAESA